MLILSALQAGLKIVHDRIKCSQEHTHTPQQSSLADSGPLNFFVPQRAARLPHADSRSPRMREGPLPLASRDTKWRMLSVHAAMHANVFLITTVVLVEGFPC